MNSTPRSASTFGLKIRQQLQRPASRKGDPGFQLDVDLDLPRTGFTVLFGRSGCGKSTILRCVAGLEKRSKGTVRMGETVWQDSSAGIFLPPEQRALGYVFQEGALFPHLTVRGNLNFAFRRVPTIRRRIRQEEVIELLELTPLLERATAGLSGGERQRVALGRALLTSPDLLLLDEPLAALDRSTRRAILPFLEQLPRRFPMPVLYVTHFLNEAARLADHLVLLDKGLETGSGPLTTMLTDPSSSLTREGDVGAVLVAEVAGHDDEFHLTRLNVSGNILLSPDSGLTKGRMVRIRILARDVSLSLEAAEGSSILNILPVEVLDLTPRDPGRVLVRLNTGHEILLALVTKKSATALNLGPGRRVFAQIKSVALL
ncbi:MAG: molybdenum ABC transporter ATP-binding protein [Gemmatimonadales bacterium]|nr:molybdenum ABC transporter ATP-binding protein [Gemmatimonadales bacterium]